MGGCGSSAFCDTAAVFGCELSGAAAGAALKLEANKIAERDSNATTKVTWRAEAFAELFLRFFIGRQEEGGTPDECFTQHGGGWSRRFFGNYDNSPNIFVFFWLFIIVIRTSERHASSGYPPEVGTRSASVYGNYGKPSNTANFLRLRVSSALRVEGQDGNGCFRPTAGRLSRNRSGRLSGVNGDP